MTYNPLVEVINAPLTIDTTIVEQLRDYRLAPKLISLPGSYVNEERDRFGEVLNRLVDRLIDGIEANPTKHWVLSQFQPSLALVASADTEVREHFGMELESIMEILAIESSDGLLACYLGGI